MHNPLPCRRSSGGTPVALLQSRTLHRDAWIVSRTEGGVASLGCTFTNDIGLIGAILYGPSIGAFLSPLLSAPLFQAFVAGAMGGYITTGTWQGAFTGGLAGLSITLLWPTIPVFLNSFLASMLGQGAGIGTKYGPRAVLTPTYYSPFAALGAGTGGWIAELIKPAAPPLVYIITSGISIGSFERLGPHIYPPTCIPNEPCWF